MQVVVEYYRYPAEIQGIVSPDERAVSSHLGGNRWDWAGVVPVAAVTCLARNTIGGGRGVCHTRHPSAVALHRQALLSEIPPSFDGRQPRQQRVSPYDPQKCNFHAWIFLFQWPLVSSENSNSSSTSPLPQADAKSSCFREGDAPRYISV
jgi:hypothetical protein